MPPRSSTPPRRGRQAAAARVFFGAAVTYKDAAGDEHVVSIVGTDEVDLTRRYIGWRSPLARALISPRPAMAVVLRAPKKTEPLEVLDVEYVLFRWNRFGPPGAEAAVRSGGGSTRDRVEAATEQAAIEWLVLRRSTVTISASVNVTVILSPTFILRGLLVLDSRGHGPRPFSPY